jgi:hypothetical protein
MRRSKVRDQYKNVVIDYFKHHSCTPLKLSGISVLPHNTQDELIREIIKISSFRVTVYPNCNRKQCRYGARRSAGDIYRIAKYYDPDIDVFSVMRILYSMATSNKVSSGYCSTIHKRVFYYSEYGILYLSGACITDELSLLFKNWKNIGL